MLDAPPAPRTTSRAACPPLSPRKAGWRSEPSLVHSLAVARLDDQARLGVMGRSGHNCDRQHFRGPQRAAALGAGRRAAGRNLPGRPHILVSVLAGSEGQTTHESTERASTSGAARHRRKRSRPHRRSRHLYSPRVRGVWLGDEGRRPISPY